MLLEFLYFFGRKERRKVFCPKLPPFFCFGHVQIDFFYFFFRKNFPTFLCDQNALICFPWFSI